MGPGRGIDPPGAIGAGPGDADELGSAVAVFRAGGLRVLEAWATALEAHALALAGDADRGVGAAAATAGAGAAAAAATAERLARSTGARGAAVVAYRALALTDGAHSASHAALAAAMARECSQRHAPTGADDGRPVELPSMVVRCFGAFTLEVQGDLLDLHGVKPRARSLLRLLMIHQGRLLHWEAAGGGPVAGELSQRRQAIAAGGGVRHPSAGDSATGIILA